MVLNKIYDKIIAVMLILLGATVIVGWIAKVPHLIQLYPSLPCMAFNTAVCFFLSGGCLLLDGTKIKGYRLILWGFAMAIFGLSCMTLLEYALDHPLKIDQFFVDQSWVSTNNNFPERMSYKTCSCFIMISLALMLLNFRQRLWVGVIVQTLCVGIFALSLNGLFSYLMGVKLLDSLCIYIQMAVHTSIGLIVISITLWFKWYNRVYKGTFPMGEEQRISAISTTILVVIVLTSGMSVFATLQNTVELSAEEKLTSTLSANAQGVENIISRALIENDHVFSHSEIKEALFFRGPINDKLKGNLHELIPSEATSFQILNPKEQLVFESGKKIINPALRLPLNLNSSLIWRDASYIETQVEIKSEGKLIGHGVIQRRVDELGKVVHFSKGLGNSGEIRICAEKGDHYMDCLPSRNTPSPLSKVPRTLEGRPVVMDYALHGKEGIILAPDYRNIFVISAFTLIKPYSLGMLIKIDADEFYKAVGEDLNQVLLLLIILVLAGILLLRYQWIPILRRVFLYDKEIRESDKRFRTLFDYAADAYFLMDSMGIIDCNRAALSILHCGNKLSLLSVSPLELSPEFQADGKTSIQKYKEIEGRLQENGHHKFDWTFVRFDETPITVEVTLNIIILNGHNVVLALWHDLTERKKYEQELLASQEHLQTIMDSSYHSIIATDLNGIITQFNRAAERMLGYSAAEVINQESLMLFHSLPEIEEKAKQVSIAYGRPIYPNFDVFIADLEKEMVIEGEYTYIRKDKSEFPVLLSMTPLMGIDNKMSGYLGIALDISEQKILEKLKGEFISTVSHELRTPLTSIRGALSLILNGVAGGMGDRMRSLLEIAQKNCERLIILINDILDIDKIEAGQMRFDLHWFDISDLVLQSVELNHEYGKKYQVQFVVHDPLPSSQVFVDRDRFIQVMTNLLSNAAKFSPAGGIVDIKITVHGERVRVCIIDQGPGIQEEFRSRIFGKFAQADSSDSRQKGGTGLGLNISKKIIEHLGGEIGFVSEPDQPTTFFFDLDLASERLPLAPVPQLTGAPLVKSKLLICGQDKTEILFLRESFERNGFNVDITFNFEQAKVILKQNKYSCFILDSRVYESPLSQLTKEIEELQGQRHLPIIVICENENQSTKIRENNGIHIIDWVLRPLDLKKLMTTVKDLEKTVVKPIVLHIEDDQDISKLISVALHSYATVINAPTIRDAKQMLRSQAIDVVLLDISLSDGSGLKLLEEEVIPPAIPVIVLSATTVSEEIKAKVVASLVKTKHSDLMIIETIKSIVINSVQIKGGGR